MKWIPIILLLAACEQERAGGLVTEDGFYALEIQCAGWCDVVLAETDGKTEVDRDKTGGVSP